MRTTKRSTKAKRNKYLEKDKIKALAALAVNKGNVSQTALELGIPRKTISRWASGENITPLTIVQAEQHKKSLAEMFEEVANKALSTAVNKLNSDASSISVEKLIDISAKAVQTSRLLKGEPTSIQEQGNAADYKGKLEALRAVRAAREDRRLAKVG